MLVQNGLLSRNNASPLRSVIMASDATFIEATGPGPRLNIKTVLSTYGDFHVLTAVLSLTWESPYLVRPSFLLRRPPVYFQCLELSL